MVFSWLCYLIGFAFRFLVCYFWALLLLGFGCFIWFLYCYVSFSCFVVCVIVLDYLWFGLVVTAACITVLVVDCLWLLIVIVFGVDTIIRYLCFGYLVSWIVGLLFCFRGWWFALFIGWVCCLGFSLLSLVFLFS